MKGDLSLAGARKLQKLLNGERIAGSSFGGILVQELVKEDILVPINRGTHRSYCLRDEQGLRTYLSQCYDIPDLELWIEIKSREKEWTRSEQVKAIGNSKLGQTRTFKGFLVSSIEPIEATLRGEPFTIQPTKGISIFVADYEHFRIPEDVVVVGIENGENFQSVHAQTFLFAGMKVLFVSRYPQSKDLRSWLLEIPNRYLHFGDFDLAGISIYLTEFFFYLRDRAAFLIPADIEERLQKGNRALYDTQYEQYAKMKITDERLQPLVDMIHQYRRGYEQEGYIEKTINR